jgi:hypothetical protein
MLTLPDAPDEEAPVLNSIEPDAPPVPESGVAMMILPLAIPVL